MPADRSVVCPRCGEGPAVPVVYGYPAPETAECAKRREIALGGCVLEPGAPQWHCWACGHSWRGRAEVRSDDTGTI